VSEAPTDTRRSTRLVLGAGVAVGIWSAALLAVTSPEQVSIASDVYYHAARAALAGEDVYTVTPPGLPGYRFIYPPVVVLAFVPHALLGSPVAAYALQTAANMLAIAGIAWVLLAALDRRDVPLDRIDRALVVAFTAASAWTTGQLVMGQTTLWLSLAIAVGLAALERDREVRAGGAVALAALVKLFPATLGAWFLRRRQYRAVGAAIATGLAGLALGSVVLGPDATHQYLTEVLVERFRGQTFEGVPDPTRNHVTVRRQLAFLLGGGSALITPLAFAIVVPPVAVCYRTVSTDARQLTAILATLVGTLLVLPLQSLYFALLLYPVVLLLFVLPAGWPRRLLVAGILGTFLEMDPETLSAVLAPLPAWVVDPVVGASRVAFTAILPPTVGMWLLLASCVAVHRSTDG